VGRKWIKEEIYMSVLELLKNRKEINKHILDGCFGVYGFYDSCFLCNIKELCKKRTIKMGIKDYKNLCWNCGWFINKHTKYKKCGIFLKGQGIFSKTRKGNCEKQFNKTNVSF